MPKVTKNLQIDARQAALLPKSTIFVTSRKWSSTLMSCDLHEATARCMATRKFSQENSPISFAIRVQTKLW